MALTFAPQAPHRIEFGGTNFLDLRPLTLPEMADLFRSVAAQLSAVFDRHTQADLSAMMTDEPLIRKFCWALLMASPDIICAAIAVAADVPQRLDEVRLLPLDVQVAALEQISRSSFPDTAMLARLMRRVGDEASPSSEHGSDPAAE